MYTACLHCARALGRNTRLETFPVGRRLAFDAAKGRLWVVCPHCTRWNLTPLEARWEAIEQAERLYRDTTLRASTGEVGLACLPDAHGAHVDLVRVGRPLLPELAAWRYGDRLTGRRRRTLLASGAVATLGGGAVAATGGAGLLPSLARLGPDLLPLGMLGLILASVLAMSGTRSLRAATPRWLRDADGQYLQVRNGLPFVRLAPAPEADGGLALRVPYDRRASRPSLALADFVNLPAAHETVLTGAPARDALRQLLPIVNGSGASARRVRDAVGVLASLGPADRALAVAAERVREWGARQVFGDTGALVHLPAEARLALEMAVHEEQERRALAGELAELEAAWREAEVIAGIADALALPAHVEARAAALRRAVAPEPPAPPGEADG